MYETYHAPWTLNLTFGQRLFRFGFPLLVGLALWRGWFRGLVDGIFNAADVVVGNVTMTSAWVYSIWNDGLDPVGFGNLDPVSLGVIAFIVVGVVSIGSGRTIGNYRRPR
ncbi:hypothetical protein [Bradyrhizobium elkanii]|uniref:hypothetical protein n=1 Tax=Bradyrhizobium elkanii TaxID=29448 RepID=UPI0035196F6A